MGRRRLAGRARDESGTGSPPRSMRRGRDRRHGTSTGSSRLGDRDIDVRAGLRAIPFPAGHGPSNLARRLPERISSTAPGMPIARSITSSRVTPENSSKETSCRSRISPVGWPLGTRRRPARRRGCARRRHVELMGELLVERAVIPLPEAPDSCCVIVGRRWRIHPALLRFAWRRPTVCT